MHLFECRLVIGRCPVALLVALQPLLAADALAESADVVVRGIGDGGPSLLATLLRLIVSLALVLLVFWGCARLVRRMNRGGFVGAGAAQAGLRVVCALSLGSRERLVVVQAGGEQLLLGVTATRIERLHLLAEPLDAPLDGGAGAFAEGGDFRSKLLAAMTRRSPS